MANVHRLGDYNNDQHPGGYRRPGGPGGQGPMGPGSDPFTVQLFREEGGNEDPRKDNCCITIKHVCCPYFHATQFVFIVSIIDILVYIGTLVHSIVLFHSLDKNQRAFLGPCMSTLVTFGAKVICPSIICSIHTKCNCLILNLIVG